MNKLPDFSPIHPLKVKPKRCCAEYFRIHTNPEKAGTRRCTRSALYKIETGYFCTVHAKDIALRVLICNKDTKE